MSSVKLVPFLTVFWLGSQLLHRVHAVDLDALWISRCADALPVHTDDVLQIGDLWKSTLQGNKNRYGNRIFNEKCKYFKRQGK